MSLSNVIAIAIPAVVLVVVIVSPKELQWRRQPWFAKGSPNRKYVVGFFLLLTLVAVLHAVT